LAPNVAVTVGRALVNHEAPPAFLSRAPDDLTRFVSD